MAVTGGAQYDPSAALPPRRQKQRRKQTRKAAPRPRTPAAQKLAKRRARRKRLRRIDRQPLYNPSMPLEGRQLRRAARILTDLELRPQVDALQRTVDNTNRQASAVQERVGGYYDDFGDDAAAAAERQKSIAERLNETLATIGAETQSTIGAAGQQAQDATRPVADRGLDGGSFAQLAAETAAAKRLAAQNSQAARDHGAQQGAGMEGLTATIPGVAALRGQESLRQISNAFALANQEPLAQIAELQGQRGALMTKNVGALRESERNYGLARDTLGLDAQKATLDARNDRANRQLRKQIARLNASVTMRGQDINRMIADRKFRLDVDKWGYERATDRYMRRHRLGRYRPGGRGSRRRLTPGQVNDAWDSVDTARTTIMQLQEQGFSSREIRQALANGYYLVGDTGERFAVPRIPGGGYGTYVNTAMDIAMKGYISPANKRALHRAGLRIGKRYPVYRRLPKNVKGPNRPA